MNESSAAALRKYLPQARRAAAIVAGTAMVAVAATMIAASSSAGAASAGPGASAVAAPQAAAAVTRDSRGSARDSRAGATAYARHLLARLRLPAGSRRMHWRRIPGLSPSLPLILSDVVDKRALYHAPEPVAALSKYLRAHVPSGLTVSSWGWSGYRGRITSESVTFTPRHLPGSLFSAELVTTFKAAKGGASLLRADAQVAWFPPRGGAVRIRASDYKSVVVTRSRLDGSHRHTKTVTGARRVAKLVALYNRLHHAPDVETSCPFMGPHTIVYVLSYRPEHAGIPAVVLSPSNCLDVSVSIGGKHEPALYPASRVNAAARRALR